MIVRRRVCCSILGLVLCAALAALAAGRGGAEGRAWSAEEEVQGKRSGPAPPYPPSPVIAGIEFGPGRSAAKGSDNWPLTWGDDGHLYTAYGDGAGFQGGGKKLSLGFARVEGPGDDFKGADIPSRDEQPAGGGRSGRKASGLLMVDGVLYAWVRNADGKGRQSQLAWSTDRAKTWTWADWKFQDLGFCVFLNFGRNYGGARDDYVYAYSPDTPDAYEETDDVVLLRVPKERVRERAAYEFFQGLDDAGRPRWTGDGRARRSVFHFAGGCNRLDVVHNAPLKRYLMTMRSRSQAGGLDQFSVFDAPEPWGPWTTVHLGPGEALGEHQHFPSKWISADGRTLYLVHSGGDAFNAQRVVLRLREK